MSDWIRLLVKFNGKCAECGKEIPAGEYALWSKSSKAIKHVKCEAVKSQKMEDKSHAGPELDCFICGRMAGCLECGFEADCDRQLVSQACVCSQCLEDSQAFTNYQRAFVEKARKVSKVNLTTL
jgi:hypothetical protein